MSEPRGEDAIMRRCQPLSAHNRQPSGMRGTVIGWCEGPQYLIRYDDGSTSWWRTDITKVFDVKVSDDELVPMRVEDARAYRYRLAWLSARKRAARWQVRWIRLAVPHYQRTIDGLRRKLDAVEAAEGDVWRGSERGQG